MLQTQRQKMEFRKLILENPLDCLLIDGALATELERRGCDLNSNLWSADVLIKNPKLIHEVHLEYFLAGADIAITSSYQAALPSLKSAGLSPSDAAETIQRSARLAKQARIDAIALQPGRKLFVAGSVGPYGAYLADGSEYRGDYQLSPEEFMAFHRSRVEALITGGVDLLVMETIPSFRETLALKSLLNDYPQMPAWFSFTLRDGMHISDGTSLEEVVEVLNTGDQVVALGVNCSPPGLATEALQNLARLTKKPLVVYPNSGEVYDASEKTWSREGNRMAKIEELAPRWYELGARFIGGCCRTTPEDIQNIRRALEPIVQHTRKPFFAED
jgi:homocysteine S-methyltransferase